MSGEKKVVRNSSGTDITVEYGGMHYRFDAGSEKEYAADVADVAQYRHGHEGLNIVAPHAEEVAARRGATPEPSAPVAPAAYQVLHQEAQAAPEPVTYRCPQGDFATNDKDAYEGHLATAHSLRDDGTPPPAAATDTPDAAGSHSESPSRARAARKEESKS